MRCPASCVLGRTEHSTDRFAPEGWPACCLPRSAPLSMDRGLICPHGCGSEALGGCRAWRNLGAAEALIAMATHFRGTQVLARPEPMVAACGGRSAWISSTSRPGDRPSGAPRSGGGGWPPFADGGPPGSGKSMLAQRPAVDPALAQPTRNMLEVSMIGSIAGPLAWPAVGPRPFRAPHHSASMAAMVGGGLRRQAGRGLAGPQRRAVFSMNCRSFRPRVLDSLRQPLEEWREHDRACQSPRHLPRALPAGRGDEPVPLRHAGEPGHRCGGAGPRCQSD